MIEDQRATPKGSVSHAERRKIPRLTIRRLAYVNLEPHDNGGVITDLSKDGLRFHMVKPVEHGGLVRLSILLGAANQVEAVGQLIWLDPTRKMGGVQFTVLPAGAAEQIIEWAQASNSVDASETRTSSRGGKVQNGSIPNQAPSESPAAASAVKPNDGAIPNHPSAPAPATLPTPAREPWAPPTARPAPAAVNHAPDPMHSADSRQPQAAAPQQWVNSGAYQPATGIPRQTTAMPSQSTSMPGAMPWITHFDPDPPPRGSTFLRGVLGGIILCALLASAAWFGMRHYGWQNGLISFSNSTPASPVTPPVTSTPIQPSPASSFPSTDGTNGSTANAVSAPEQPEPTSVPRAQIAPHASTPNWQAGSNVRPAGDGETPLPTPAQTKPATTPGTSDSPEASTPQAEPTAPAPGTTLGAEKGASATNLQHGALPVSESPRPVDSGETQLQLARQYLDGRGRPRNAMVASQLLWSAVEKGNSVAEMDLADLYLHGDGVARNCDQARVLLSVASQKGNTEATQKLSDLNRTGCR
jgi:hypothetical protein